MKLQLLAWLFCFAALSNSHSTTTSTKPLGGYLLGGGVIISATTQIAPEGGEPNAQSINDGKELKIIVPPATRGKIIVAYKPAEKLWDLRDYLAVSVQIRNDGNTPATPQLRMESTTGATDWIEPEKPLPAGTSTEVIIPFAAREIWTSQDKKSGNKIANDTVRALEITIPNTNTEQTLTVTSVRAIMPSQPVLPDWLGKRPPVDGDWSLTFEDNFNGDKIDGSKWHYYGDNYWDKSAHFSKDNAFLKDGFAHLRFEKKRGHHEDNPEKAETPYATGFLETYGKWTQRYGYFEARMKPPTAPGLWPAFWMMPDRGKESVPSQTKPWDIKTIRQDTYKGGMEFDIYEYLTRWGSNRYNIALHWDGIDKDHKTAGSDRIYAQADKDGFFTCGLLWLPGKAIFYCNGQEVLRYENDRISNVQSGMIFTLPSGGWDNNALDDKLLPADFVIDYVRVWQRKDLASPEDGYHQDPTP